MLSYLQEWIAEPVFGLWEVVDTSHWRGMYDALVTDLSGQVMKVDAKVNKFRQKPQVTLEFEKKKKNSGVWVPSYALEEVDSLFTLCVEHRQVFYTALERALLFGLKPLRPHFKDTRKWMPHRMGDNNALGLHRDPKELIDLGCCIELTGHLDTFHAAKLEQLCAETLRLFAEPPAAA